MAILGVIIGVVGLGFGAYSFYQIRTGVSNGKDGDDGDDGKDGANGIIDYTKYKTYYCASQSEIVTALASIGTGHGIIIITEDIILTSRININGGGNYIIQGVGSVLDLNVNNYVFYITNAHSLTLKDLIINRTGTSGSFDGIMVQEGNNYPVHIQNVQLIGGPNCGIHVNSKNVWIEDCIIKDTRYGIDLTDSSGHCYLLNNRIFDLTGSITIAINVEYSEFNVIIGNMIYNIKSTWDLAMGINMEWSDSSIISDNMIYDISSTESSIGICVFVCDNITVKGNIIENIIGGDDYVEGIGITESDHSNINGNIIIHIDGTLGLNYGIHGQSGSDYNAIVGNTIYNSFNGISVSGIGNVIQGNVVV